MLLRSSLVLCLALSAPSTHATDIYQWVDDAGKTQVSDVVPEKYRAKATRLDSQRFELTPAQKAEAEAGQAARRAAERTTNGTTRQPGDNTATGPAASLSGAPRAASAPTDCDTLQRRYEESQACFAPFKNVNGTMKPGANEVCTEVPDPSPQCGLPRLP